MSKSKQLDLKYPIICHGYSSVLNIALSEFFENEDEAIRAKIDEIIAEIFRTYKKINNEYSIKNINLLEEGNYFVQGHRDDLSFLLGTGGIFLVFLKLLERQNEFDTILIM